MSERIVTSEWIAIQRRWNAIGVVTPVSMLHALDEVERLQAAVERVRALHHNRMRGSYTCAECRDDYPCPTIRALEGTP